MISYPEPTLTLTSGQVTNDLRVPSSVRIRNEDSGHEIAIECTEKTQSDYCDQSQDKEPINNSQPKSRREKRKNVCEQVGIVSGFISDWTRKCREIFLTNHE